MRSASSGANPPLDIIRNRLKTCSGTAIRKGPRTSRTRLGKASHPPAGRPLTVDLHPEVDPDGDGAGDQGAAERQFPLARGRLHLGERLTEGSPVQLLHLLLGQLAPVALLLLTQSLTARRGRRGEVKADPAPAHGGGWARRVTWFDDAMLCRSNSWLSEINKSFAPNAGFDCEGTREGP